MNSRPRLRTTSPKMDGFEFIARLRECRAWRDIPIVVVTAKDLSGDERGRLNGRVTKVLRKSACRRDELLAEVRDQVRAGLQLPASAATG